MLKIIVLLSGFLVSVPLAQAGGGPLTNACQTNYGVCFVGVAPAGAPCGCNPAPNVFHPGRMIFLAPPPSYPVQAPPQQQQPVSNACGTRFGVCQTMPARLGSPCGCGIEPGRVIFLR
jgi:hypothetical protein